MSAELLAANLAFYEAFAAGDADAMEDLWASGSPVACTHPGYTVVHGRRDVLASWSQVLSAPPPIRCMQPVAHLLGDAGFVTCVEVVGDIALAATNVFVREDGGWRLVHHHAGPIPGGPPVEQDWN